MTRAELLGYLREQRLAVQTSVSPDGGPQGAVVGVVISDAIEVFFDTLERTRKVRNLRADPRIGFVFGNLAGGDERTVQYEGVADEPSGADLERLCALYFASFPDGPARRAWPGLLYVRARPTWIRYADYARTPPLIVEYDGARLAALLRE